jgi:DNA-binding HxlR family transcriptional regulator
MPDCGLDVALAVIGGKWKMLILYHVCHGTRRFGELRRLLPGISEKMLIQDLRQMQASDLVTRKDYKEVPPRVEYSITPFGRALGKSLRFAPGESRTGSVSWERNYLRERLPKHWDGAQRTLRNHVTRSGR